MKWWIKALIASLLIAAGLALLPAYAAFDHNPQQEFVDTYLKEKSLANIKNDLLILYGVWVFSLWLLLAVPALIVAAIVRRRH